MPRKTNTKIMKRHLILCEGRDEKEFLIAWLNSAALHSVPAFSEEIQVIDFGGNQDLPAYLRLLQNAENFDKVRSILVIRDAEKDAKRAVFEIQESFHNNDLPVPKTEFLKLAFCCFQNLTGNRNAELWKTCASLFCLIQMLPALQKKSMHL